MQDTSSPSRTTAASDRLVRSIIRAIYEGELSIGQRLVEAQIMERYGVSRSTVREAVKRLAAEGVVEVVLHKGATIRRPDRREVIELLRLTEVLVGLSARLAAERIGEPGRRDAFATESAEIIAALGTTEGHDYARQRNRFHRALQTAGGNREVGRAVSNLQLHLVRAHTFVSREAHLASYRAMRDAVLAGDGAAAEAAGRHHVALLIDAVRASRD